MNNPGNFHTQQVPITPEMMKNAKQSQCECGSVFFKPVVQQFTLSHLVSPVGQDLLWQVPCLICARCDKPLQAQPEDTHRQSLSS